MRLKRLALARLFFFVAFFILGFSQVYAQNKKDQPKMKNKYIHRGVDSIKIDTTDSSPPASVHFGIQQQCNPGASMCNVSNLPQKNNDSTWTNNSAIFTNDTTQAPMGALSVTFPLPGLSNAFTSFINNGMMNNCGPFIYTFQGPFTLDTNITGWPAAVTINDGSPVGVYESTPNCTLSFFGAMPGYSGNLILSSSGKAPNTTLSISSIDPFTVGCTNPVYMSYGPYNNDTAQICMILNFNSPINAGGSVFYNCIQGMDTNTCTAGTMVFSSAYTFPEGTCNIPAGTVIAAGSYPVNSMSRIPFFGNSSPTAFYYPGWFRIYFNIPIASPGYFEKKFNKRKKYAAPKKKK